MAIYHFSGTIISRSQGRSSVAASAYRAAEKTVDERTGLTHNFQKKSHDLIHKEILAPESAPGWMKGRAKLWNYVETIEKRKDAQLAREFNIALPKEFTQEQNIALAREFVQNQFVDKGMIADLCIHAGHKGGADQPHAHLMLSLREITPEGFGKKVRVWNDKTLLQHWRETWAHTCNHHLGKHGHDIQIDHRTLAAQGINLEPQSKIGPKIAQDHLAKLAEHQEIAKNNGERLIADPQIAFKALTQQQSTFTHQDLARFINRHSASHEQFNAIYEKLKQDPELIKLGFDEQGRERFTTQTMHRIEQQLFQDAQHLAQNQHHRVSPDIQQQILQTHALHLEQQQAFHHLLNNNDAACLVGFAGSGKSYLMCALNQAWGKSGYQVIGASLTGIGAENLEASSGIKSFTIANRLINWEHEREKLHPKTILVIDEAGMVDTRQMVRLLKATRQAQAKIVLSGDPQQLQPIQAGAAFRGLVERLGHVALTQIYRQQEPWQQQATRNLALQNTKLALKAYADQDCLHRFDYPERAIEEMVSRWEQTRSENPQHSQILLAYTRKEVQTLNENIRAIRKQQGEITNEQPIETARGKRDMAVGDIIYFLRNEKSLDVKNGTLGTITALANKAIQVQIHGKGIVKVNLNSYNHIDHGYAATVHKAQGVTVDRSLVLASRYFDRHITYVAMSRHRDTCELFYSQSTFPTERSLSMMLSRQSHKDLIVDYALGRGIEPLTLEGNYQQSIRTHLSSGARELAETRLNERLNRYHLNQAVTHLSQQFEKPIETELTVGEQGIYCGLREVGGRQYHLMESSEAIKIIPVRQHEHGFELNTPVGVSSTCSIEPEQQVSAFSLEKVKGLKLELEQEIER